MRSGPESDSLGDVRAEDAVTRLQQDLLAGELVAGIAHDINNPLTSLMAHIRLGMRMCTDPALLERLTKMEREAERIALLNEQILRLARHSADRGQPVELGALMGDVGQVLAYELRTRRATLEVEEGTMRALRGNPAELRQAMVNMVRSIAAACPPGATIRMGARQEGDALSVRVRGRAEGGTASRDALSALGSERESMERLLGESGEAAAVVRRRLGLLVARRVAKAHGGSLEVRETEEGKVELALLLAARRPRPDAG